MWFRKKEKSVDEHKVVLQEGQQWSGFDSPWPDFNLIMTIMDVSNGWVKCRNSDGHVGIMKVEKFKRVFPHKVEK